MCCISSTGIALQQEKPRILILAQEFKGYTSSIAKSIETSTLKDNYLISSIRLENWQQQMPTTLYIALGIEALEFLQQQKLKAPVLGALVTSNQWFNYQQKKAQKVKDLAQFSAIFYDPDLSKQLILTKEILFPSASIGLLHSSDYWIDKNTLKKIATQLELKINFSSNNKSKNFYKNYTELVNNNDALILLPDKAVYNHNTLPKALLTSYRQNKYVIGYSKGTVKSGALATSYTSSKQYTQDIIESSIKLITQKNSGPIRRHSQYFSIMINTQVAKSMGILLPSESSLLEKVQATWLQLKKSQVNL